MERHHHLPDSNQLSMVAVVILLAYTLARFIELPEQDLSIQLPGVYLPYRLNIRTVVALLVGVMTATGADWMLRRHPHSRGHSMLEHWLLPALSALVLGVPLLQLPFGWPWLAVFVIGGALLMLVLLAEYIAIDPEDLRQPIAAAGLIALSFALFLILAITLRTAGTRLYMLLPGLILAAMLVSLRTLHLRLHGSWELIYALVVGLVCAQLSAGLHYLPISATVFGLLLTAPVYTLTSLLGSLAKGTALQQALVEPIVVLVIMIGTALWIG